MSLTAAGSAVVDELPKVVLRSSDQFALWKERVSNLCWAATHVDVFSLSDDQCDRIMKAYDDAKKDRGGNVVDVVGKCWVLLTSHLSDELLMKVSHVRKGAIATLLFEIRAGLCVNTMDDVQPLRIELYSASMAQHCNNDLQSYISYIIARKDKLSFLKCEVPELELIHIFFKGLSPVFNALQVHFAIPGTMPTSFTQAIMIVRSYSSNPVVSAELAKAKSPANIMVNVASASRPQRPNGTIFCRLFANSGSCKFGQKCKFSHGAQSQPTPNHPAATSNNGKDGTICFYCKKKGHVAAVCRKKQFDLNKGQTESKQSSLSLTSATSPLQGISLEQHPFADGQEEEESYVLVFGTTTEDVPPNAWVCDSGATASATFNAEDCTNITDCRVMVTAAGTSFEVNKKGTAHILVQDTSGRPVRLFVQNCLISDKFPYKLLALQAFTNKGHTVYMQNDEMLLFSPSGGSVLKAAKDRQSKLFLLATVNKGPAFLEEKLEQEKQKGRVNNSAKVVAMARVDALRRVAKEWPSGEQLTGKDVQER
jgi:hypothetical protein